MIWVALTIRLPYLTHTHSVLGSDVTVLSSTRTPVTASYSRSGRRVTQINFANQF